MLRLRPELSRIICIRSFPSRKERDDRCIDIPFFIILSLFIIYLVRNVVQQLAVLSLSNPILHTLQTGAYDRGLWVVRPRGRETAR